MSLRFLSSIFIVSTAVFAARKQAAPEAEVDMRLRPQERFKAAVRASLRESTFEEGFGMLFAQWNATTFDKLSVEDYQVMTSSLEKYFPTQALELRGISEEFLAHGHPVYYEYLVAWAYSHEVGHVENMKLDPLAAAQPPHHDCSALLVADKDGHMMHGRNMDQASPEHARKITLKLKYTNLGPEQADIETLDFYWFAGGIVTAVVKNGVSLQENWRAIELSKEEIFHRISLGAVPHKYMFREMLVKEKIHAFYPSIAYLSNLYLAAPVYIAIAGSGKFEGTIITMDASGMARPAQSLTPNWFIVETNHDNWLPDPVKDPRRTAAEQCIMSNGEANDELSNGQTVLTCLSTPPVLNKGTIYSAVMNPRTGSMSAWVRFDGANPEDLVEVMI